MEWLYALYNFLTDFESYHASTYIFKLYSYAVKQPLASVIDIVAVI